MAHLGYINLLLRPLDIDTKSDRSRGKGGKTPRTFSG